MQSDREIEAIMSLTERERIILQLSRQGLSDYRIARKINTDPPSVTRSRKNVQKKLLDAVTDLEWASRIGVSFSDKGLNVNSSTSLYSFSSEPRRNANNNWKQKNQEAMRLNFGKC